MALAPCIVTPFPRMPPWVTGITPNYVTTITLNGSLEKFGCVFCPPKTGSIRKVHFRTVTALTPPTDPIDIRIETVASTGLPSGTLWGTNTNVAHSTIAAQTWYTSAALTADAVITNVNTAIAVVISNPVANFGNWNIATIGSTFSGSPGRPYPLLYTGSWAKQNLMPVLAIEYSDGSIEYIQGMWPISSFLDQATQSGSTPDEWGIKFRVPFKARLKGFWAIFALSSLSADFEIALYNEAGTAVLTRTFNSDIMRGIGHEPIEEYFDGTFTLEPDTDYRLSVRPTTANTVTACSMECASVALMNALPGGANVHWTERTDAGTWTDNTTRWPMLGLLLDQLGDDAVAGGVSGEPDSAIATATAPTPKVVLTATPAAASAAATVPTPTVSLSIQVPLAAASATVPAPTVSLAAGLATASATATVPTPTGRVIAHPAAAAASAVAPQVITDPSGSQTEVEPGAAPATATVPTPTVRVKAMAAPAVASATAPDSMGVAMAAPSPAAAGSATVPVPKARITVHPAAAAAQAVANSPTTVPAGNLTEALPGAGPATATVPTPTVRITVRPGAAAATAVSPAPAAILIAIPSVAMAVAMGLDPTTNPSAFIFVAGVRDAWKARRLPRAWKARNNP